MSATLSAEAVPSTTDRAPGGRFAAGNAGGPGNPFARQTAALRAYLIEHVTERDIQDILDILLLNAKGGHLPTIKLLFSYVLGKPKPVVEPDLLDLQELQRMQQSAMSPEALEELCDQLPLDFQVQLTRHAQADNVVATVQTALDNTPGAPSTNRHDGEQSLRSTVAAPSTNGPFGAARPATPPLPPSPNGEMRQSSKPPPGFAWLNDLRRAFRAPPAT